MSSFREPHGTLAAKAYPTPRMERPPTFASEWLPAWRRLRSGQWLLEANQRPAAVAGWAFRSLHRRASANRQALGRCPLHRPAIRSLSSPTFAYSRPRAPPLRRLQPPKAPLGGAPRWGSRARGRRERLRAVAAEAGDLRAAERVFSGRPREGTPFACRYEPGPRRLRAVQAQFRAEVRLPVRGAGRRPPRAGP